MSNSLTFTNYVELIASGGATSADITNEDCVNLSSLEKQALLTILAQTQVESETQTVVLQELKGEIEGGDLEVPSFLYGQLIFVDVDNTATIGEAGTTQVVTDSDNDVVSETSSPMFWHHVKGRHYSARTLTIPAGVKVRYLFTLAN